MLEIEYLAKDGTKTFDINQEATTRFGFLYQDRVKTPLGEASVIGVCENHLWFHVDGDAGASFWETCKTAEDFQARGFVKLRGADEQGTLDPNEFHKKKRITFHGREVDLVMQNINGPCPVIALANALSLKGYQVVPPDASLIPSTQLRRNILDLIRSRTDEFKPNGALTRGDKMTLSGLAGDAERMAKLRGDLTGEDLLRFYQGLDVSPFFTEVDGFDGDKDGLIFSLAGCRLCHGWIIDEASSFARLREFSYDDLTALMTEEEKEEGRLAGVFLTESSSQLTEAGLQLLLNRLDDGEVVVLFRNNHFGTLMRTGDMLVTVVSDEGYADREVVVFEELNLFGGGEFYDADMYKVEDFVLSVVAVCGSKYSDTDIRSAQAELLSEFPAESPTIDQLIDRLKRNEPVKETTKPSLTPRDTQAPSSVDEPSQQQNDPVAILMGMGFPERESREALQATGAISSAIDLLTSA